MKKLMYLVPLIGCAFGLLTCNEKTGNEVPDPVPIIFDESITPDGIVALMDYYRELPEEELSIENAEIVEDILRLKVYFLGGCAEHEFGFVAARGFLETNPPTAQTWLTNNARGDTCTDSRSVELLFDLTPLKEHSRQMGLTDRIWMAFLGGLFERLTYEI